MSKASQTRNIASSYDKCTIWLNKLWKLFSYLSKKKNENLIGDTSELFELNSGIEKAIRPCHEWKNSMNILLILFKTVLLSKEHVVWSLQKKHWKNWWKFIKKTMAKEPQNSQRPICMDSNSINMRTKPWKKNKKDIKFSNCPN